MEMGMMKRLCADDGSDLEPSAAEVFGLRIEVKRSEGKTQADGPDMKS
jgi:hypothetical protein